MSNKRWILVCNDRHGNVSMMESVQGTNTYATADEALAHLRDLKANNAEDRLASIWGQQAIGTMGVRCVECWPGHNDPVACVFEPYGLPILTREQP